MPYGLNLSVTSALPLNKLETCQLVQTYFYFVKLGPLMKFRRVTLLFGNGTSVPQQLVEIFFNTVVCMFVKCAILLLLCKGGEH